MNLDKIAVQQQRNPFHLAYELVGTNSNGMQQMTLTRVQKTTETKIKKKYLLNFIKNNSYLVNKEITNIAIVPQLITMIVKEANEIAKLSRRGTGNILLCGETVYTFIMSFENREKFPKSWEIYLSTDLANNEMIMTYKSITKDDAGIFVAEDETAETDDEIYVSTFDLNEISNTKNYYRHIIFENLK